MSFAAIDIGTNSVLLLIAQSPLQVIRDEARITRLGEGLHKSHLFTPAAIQRTFSVLQEYDTLCRQHQVKKVICVGTAAFRKAENGKEFCREIEKRFGWETKIISGDEEARLSYLSVERDFRDRYKDLAALDIGGGSTEIISKEGGVSLELGTVVLSERYLKQDLPDPAEIEKMKQEIDRLITPPHPPSYIKRGVTVVALAGTATTLSSVNQKLKEWNPQKIQGSAITREELEAIIALLKRTTLEEKKKIPGMIPGREDTLLAGALILEAVMEKLGTKRVIVSDRGLRYGLFYQDFFDTDSSPS